MRKNVRKTGSMNNVKNNYDTYCCCHRAMFFRSNCKCKKEKKIHFYVVSMFSEENKSCSKMIRCSLPFIASYLILFVFIISHLNPCKVKKQQLMTSYVCQPIYANPREFPRTQVTSA